MGQIWVKISPWSGGILGLGIFGVCFGDEFLTLILGVGNF